MNDINELTEQTFLFITNNGKINESWLSRKLGWDKKSKLTKAIKKCLLEVLKISADAYGFATGGLRIGIAGKAKKDRTGNVKVNPIEKLVNYKLNSIRELVRFLQNLPPDIHDKIVPKEWESFFIKPLLDNSRPLEQSASLNSVPNINPGWSTVTNKNTGKVHSTRVPTISQLFINAATGAGGFNQYSDANNYLRATPEQQAEFNKKMKVWSKEINKALRKLRDKLGILNYSLYEYPELDSVISAIRVKCTEFCSTQATY